MICQAIGDSISDVVPHALLWRSVQYFSSNYSDRVDEFDAFRCLEYRLGNWLRFDLRRYEGHPEGTSTIYFPLDFNEEEDINYGLSRVLDALRMPRMAVAWRRGDPFTFGVISRPISDRLREAEAGTLALKIAAGLPDRAASTDQLIELAPTLFEPSIIDKEPSRTRAQQPRWHQIIRNVISHRTSPRGPFKNGLAVRTRDGLQVTAKGSAYLIELGYYT